MHDPDIANEVYEKYKEYDCLYFINRKQKGTTYTTIKKGETDYFQKIIGEYKKWGCSVRALIIKGISGVK